MNGHEQLERISDDLVGYAMQAFWAEVSSLKRKKALTDRAVNELVEAFKCWNGGAEWDRAVSKLSFGDRELYQSLLDGEGDVASETTLQKISDMAQELLDKELDSEKNFLLRGV